MRELKPIYPAPKAFGVSIQPGQPPPATAQLSFLFSPRGFGATVTAGKFLDASRRVHELLFAGEKGMTSSANTDLNIAARRTGVIHRATCARYIGLVILWMNT